MTEIPKPGKKSRLPAAPASSNISIKNLQSGDFKDMNFKVDPEFHREFKMRAIQDGMTMLALLKKSFEAYKNSVSGDNR